MQQISYAQNFEDIMLWRALKLVKNGFYIDIGAYHPEEDSVTKLFYENNWNGINIEPNPTFHQQLELTRHRDTNIGIAISTNSGSTPFYIIEQSGLPTGLSTLSYSLAKTHQLNNGFSIKTKMIELMTLESVWKKYLSKNQEVHFLKIDVEGSEKIVLQSNNWEQNQPWIVLVESTLPLTQEECFIEWEEILLNSGYSFVYTDALNRFYISKKHTELIDAFKYPPNLYDNFITYRQINTPQAKELFLKQLKTKTLLKLLFKKIFIKFKNIIKFNKKSNFLVILKNLVSKR